MITSFDQLNLNSGDRIAVSFAIMDVKQAIGMVEALFAQKVIVKAIVDLPLRQNSYGESTEYKIKTVDAFTDSLNEDDKPCKRKK